ncbi:MAG: FtsQ-type POTRA domain-containing protein [Spirochaetales bacterium]|nr:FtsQ-type POTRA domain-containing protein [Spirochaetales bacterium]
MEQAEAGSGENSNGKLYFTLGLFVISVIFLGAGAFLLFQAEQDARVVSEIEVEGNHYYSDQEILELTDLSINRSIRAQELKALRKRLLMLPAILDFSWKREGSRLILLVRERECAAIVRTGLTEELLFEIDYDLFIISENKVRCKNVPLVSGNFERSLDRFRDMTLYQLLAGFRLLKKDHPEMASRISEMRPGKAGELSLFTMAGARMELAGGLDGRNIKRLYAAFAFMEQEKKFRGVFDLRGADVLFVPGI